jgi:cobalt/nickel transport system permease protein
MNRRIIVTVGVAALLLLGGYLLGKTQSEWSGVDESVVERVAITAGRPPREPLINTDQGDILLLVFLLAGACGGFVAGYSFRTLFPAKRESSAP